MTRRAGVFYAALILTSRLFADSTVVFNEVMYHPATNELTQEWIELRNMMSIDMDISRWRIRNGVDFTFPAGTIVPGGGFIVVAISPPAVAGRVPAGVRVLGPWAGQLSNGGDHLELVNNSGRVMDKLDYETDNKWPVPADGSGASLTRLDEDSASNDPRNWTFSPEIGGTPGRRNFPVKNPFRRIPGLVSYWDFEEQEGPAIDRVSGNHGALGSGVLRVQGMAGQKSALFLNLAASYVDLGASNNTFRVTSGVTVELAMIPLWTASSGEYDTLFRKEDGNQRILVSFQNDANNGSASPAVPAGPVLSFGLNVDGTYTELDMPLDGQQGRPTPESLKDGKAHLFTATYDEASGKKSIYIDGRLGFQTVLHGSIVSGGSGSPVLGNAGVSGSEPALGTMDEVSFWSRALSESEIAAHFANLQQGRSCIELPASSPAPSLRFNEQSGVTNSPFFVEVINAGTAAVDAARYVVNVSGSVERSIPIPSGLIPPGGFLVLTETLLGGRPSDGDKLFLVETNASRVADGIVLKNRGRARHPDATGEWLFPRTATSGASNLFEFHHEIVINEIMYHHRPNFRNGTNAFAKIDEAWVELFNRGSAAVDLTGWRIDEGIDFRFPAGMKLNPGEFLVVARDAASLGAKYPGISILGNFDNKLSHSGERIVLKDAANNPADVVEYYDGGDWPEYAGGGGSSLELIHPDADNRVPQSWRASNERGKTAWKQYSYRKVAAADTGSTQWSEFIIGLLDAGEVLIDDIQVIESPDGARKSMLQDGTFETAQNAWRFLGNHGQSEIIADPDGSGNHVLHIVSTGATEHQHNHIETTLPAANVVTNGLTYEISFRARWLAGSPQLNTRLYFNRCPQTTILDLPAKHGTPGAPNSVFRTDYGPAITDLRHEPIVPRSGEPVTVSVRALDASDIAACTLFWTTTNGNWSSVAMSARGDGTWTNQVPGMTQGTIVQFYVSASRAGGGMTFCPLAGPDSRALYQAHDGRGRTGLAHTLRLIMTLTDTNRFYVDTNLMSNGRMGGTLVLDESIPYYNVGIRLKGSERGRVEDSRIGYNVSFAPYDRFRGVHSGIAVDRSGGWRYGRNFGQDEIVIKHMIQHAGNIPGMYNDLIQILPTRASQTGPGILQMAGYGSGYLDSEFQDGSDGTSFEFELIYYPTSTALGTPDSPKKPAPDNVVGTDITDLGNDPERYRWNFLIENNKDRDDYSRLMAMCKAFSLSGTNLDQQSRAVMDIDEWMRVFAMLSLCGVGDTYTQGNNHNLILYVRPKDDQILAFPWDWDFAFTRGTADSIIGDQNLGKIINLPGNKRFFYGHLLDIINTTYNRNYMAYWVPHLSSFLPGQDFSDLLGYIEQRGNFVKTQLPKTVPFAITSNGGRDFSTNSTMARLQGTAWINVHHLALAGNPKPLDAQWGASDWTTFVPLVRGKNRIEIQGIGFEGELVASDVIFVSTTAGDTDGDGMPDSWETQNNLRATQPDGDLDPDGDGATNLQEYLAGTDPHNASSIFKITQFSLETQGANIVFNAVAGRTYKVQTESGLESNKWKTIQTFSPTNSGPIQLVAPVSGSRGFVRVIQ